jgi:hypothetical protein
MLAFSGQHTVPNFTLYNAAKGQATNYYFSDTTGLKLTSYPIVYTPKTAEDINFKGSYVIEVGHYLDPSYQKFHGQNNSSSGKRYDPATSIPRDLMLIKVWYCSSDIKSTSQTYKVRLVYSALRYSKP